MAIDRLEHPETTLVFDYIYDNVLPMIRKDFKLAAPEDVFYPFVEIV